MKEEVLNKVLSIKVVAVIRLNSDKNIFGLVEALGNGGIPIVEITLTTPNALSIIEKLSEKYSNEIIVGVGSVLNEQMAEDSINAGAKYLVSPIMKPELIEIAHKNDIPAMIGAFSPTEIQLAWETGADVVKVFPANILGMNFFKGVLVPMPHLKLMPTGGVNLDNPGQWIQAGACAVGIGSALVDKEMVALGNFGKIKSNAERVISNIKKLNI
jgi:2-dehydro-3-deoxyphosphogluconate aldolase/(4S)-4-hydroxy-2-oxoglutarate aldolase